MPGYIGSWGSDGVVAGKFFVGPDAGISYSSCRVIGGEGVGKGAGQCIFLKNNTTNILCLCVVFSCFKTIREKDKIIIYFLDNAWETLLRNSG